jgi:uncharacterized membrane protein
MPITAQPILGDFRMTTVNSRINNSRITIASAAALMALASFATAPAAFAADAAPCYGVNSCKGMSDCKSGDHSCKGQNSCKGQGFKDITAKECAAQHGSTTPPAK